MVTHCVVQGQVLIGGPDIPTLGGLVGGPVRLATAVASDNPGATALTIGRGIVANFGNRAVIASGSTLNFSDPVDPFGGDIRTFTVVNQNSTPGIIYGLHEGAGGMLVCLTSAGTWGLDASNVAVGELGAVGTDWRVLSHIGATSFCSSAVCRGRVYGLTADGWAFIDTESTFEQVLSQRVQPRAYGPRISMSDYRDQRMYSMDLGPIVAASSLNALHRSDITVEPTLTSWWTSAYSPTAFSVRGVLRHLDGTEMLIAENGIFVIDGNMEGDLALSSAVSTQPQGVLFDVLPTSPDRNTLVRGVTCAAEVGGAGSLYAAVRGAGKSAVPYVDPQGITIGTDAWGITTKRYTSTPLASVQFQFGEDHCSPTRDVGIEIAVDGCMSRIGSIADVEYSKSAPQRAAQSE